MRTNVVIDDQLIRTAMQLTHARTKREVVDLALRRLVQLELQQAVLGLEGAIEWVGDLDASREGRLHPDTK
ncbi:MAG: type II toxin-antitoxin system VapB family antitoxin [Deferrisomatales bacterium]|nr:type II toxin-antitoxin system VapB family antitoxin [Deferrisomatales bacterium]